MAIKVCKKCQCKFKTSNSRVNCDDCKTPRKVNLKYKIHNIDHLEGEEWKEIKDFESYLISNKGRVFSKARGLKNPSIHKSTGYYQIHLYKNGKAKHFHLHRLIAVNFIPNDNPEYDVIDHINQNKIDNRIENLRWCSQQINVNNSDRVLKRKGGVRFFDKPLKRPWYVQYYMPDITDKKMRAKYFATEEEAKEFLAEAQAKYIHD